MEEKRRHERIQASLEIRVTWPGGGILIGNTLDISDGGAFVHVTFEPPPPVNTEILLQLTSLVNGREAPVLKARVVRTTPEGIAFEFVQDL